MEVFPYIIDVVMFAVACYWSAANTILKPGEQSFGLFRFRMSAKARGTLPNAAADRPKQAWKR